MAIDWYSKLHAIAIATYTTFDFIEREYLVDGLPIMLKIVDEYSQHYPNEAFIWRNGSENIQLTADEITSRATDYLEWIARGLEVSYEHDLLKSRSVTEPLRLAEAILQNTNRKDLILRVKQAILSESLRLFDQYKYSGAYFYIESLFEFISRQGICIEDVLGFYVNGLLLRKFHIKWLYFGGSILQGIVAFFLVLFAVHGTQELFVLGTFFGLGSGVYWGNKNYISLQLTRNTNRIYYTSLEQIIDLLINIVVPVLTGWFIVYATSLASSTIESTYRIVMLIGFVFLFLSGLVIQFAQVADVTNAQLTVRKVRPIWWFIRLFNLLYNTAMGLSLVISSILILVLVGNEGILGTFQTITAFLSSLFLYVLGRKSTIASSWKFIGIGSLVYFGGSLMLAGTFNWVGVIVYLTSSTIAWVFQWTPSYSLIMEVMDREETDPDTQYAYVCDNELFFNLGTIILATELFFALVINALVLKEYPTTYELIGGLLIFSGTAVTSLSLKKKKA